MTVQQISLKNTPIAKQTQNYTFGVTSVSKNSAGDSVEFSNKKKEDKTLKYTLGGIGALLGIIAIVKHKSISKLFKKAPEVNPDTTIETPSKIKGATPVTDIQVAKNTLLPLENILKSAEVESSFIEKSEGKGYQLWHFTSPAFLKKFLEMHDDLSGFCKQSNIRCHSIIDLQNKAKDTPNPNHEKYLALTNLIKEKTGVDLLEQVKHYRFISKGELDVLRTKEQVENKYSYVTLCPDYGLSCNTFDYRVTFKNTPNVLDNLDYYHDTQYKNGIKKPYSYQDVEKVEKLLEGKWQEVEFLPTKEIDKPNEPPTPSSVTTVNQLDSTKEQSTDTDELLKYLTPEEVEKYKNNALVKAGIITPEMQLMFAKIKNLDGEEFIKTTYVEMTKMLGYEDCAPLLYIKRDLGDTKASYGAISGDIEFDAFDSHHGTQFQVNSISSLRHELEHFIQLTTIARTEGLGIDAICRAKAKSNIKRLKLDKKLCLEFYNRPFEQLNKKNIFEKLYTEYKADINVPFYEKVIQKKGVIPKDSPEAKTSKEYFNALENYTNAHGTTDELLLKNYEDNLLEKQAKSKGLWLSNYFSFLVP